MHVRGLPLHNLICEPSSAAIAYVLDKRADDIHSLKDKTALKFKIGGQTFDVSLLDISEDGIITVIEFQSDNHMGDEDLDKAMVIYCVQMFQQKEKKELSNSGRAMTGLKEACKNAKTVLSSTSETYIYIDSLYEGINFSITFTRAKLEYLNRGFFDKYIEHVETLLDGDMHKKVEQMLTGFLEGKPLFSSWRVMPEEVVAYGAAVLAAKVGGTGKQLVQDLLLLDTAPLSVDIGLVGDIMSGVIPRNKITEKRFLNTSELDGIPANREGVQKLKVSFTMDVNADLNVSAAVKCNGNKRSLTIPKSGHLV